MGTSLSELQAASHDGLHALSTRIADKHCYWDIFKNDEIRVWIKWELSTICMWYPRYRLTDLSEHHPCQQLCSVSVEYNRQVNK